MGRLHLWSKVCSKHLVGWSLGWSEDLGSPVTPEVVGRGHPRDPLESSFGVGPMWGFASSLPYLESVTTDMVHRLEALLPLL